MKNKTVIVTGGAKGIGKAIALKFASEGANIVLNYRSSSPDEVKSEILSAIKDIEDYKISKGILWEIAILTHRLGYYKMKYIEFLWNILGKVTRYEKTLFSTINYNDSYFIFDKCL